MNKGIEDLLKDESTAVITGAGVSVESGIKSFSDLYKTLYKGFKPELILSNHFMMSHYEIFLDFIFDNFSCDYKPNLIHDKLANINPNLQLITQNIDGLHQKAGSRKVVEMHGNMNIWKDSYGNKAFFNDIKEKYKASQLNDFWRPDIVLYGEGLLLKNMEKAETIIKSAKSLVVLGTRLQVDPFAKLIEQFNGKNLIICNRTQTAYDNIANKVIRENLTDIFGEHKEVEKSK